MKIPKNISCKLLKLVNVLVILLIKESKGLKRSETLDPNGIYHVAWELDNTRTNIMFEVTVKTVGYVGFGISPTGGMAGSDIIIGGVLTDGSSYFEDRYAETNGMPKIDTKQDWTLLAFSEENGITHLKFSRLVNTCDDQDVPITGDAQRFIWAYGQDDDIDYHEDRRGSIFVNILDPPTPELDLSEYHVFDALVNLSMPSKKTSYWCSVHRSPFFSSKQHILAFGPKVVSSVAQKHTHHFMFNLCKAPVGEDPERFFEQFIVPGGEDCFAGTASRSLEIYNYCSDTIYSWAMGAGRMHMPEGVGFPLSDGGREYFMLETHVNNPGHLENISFESGVEIHYTANLRAQEASSFSMGTGSEWALLIPPSSSNFRVAAHCTPDCTHFIEPDGYTLFNVQLHAHTSARKMRLRHFRDGMELPWIADDQTYDNSFQSNRNINQVKFYPRDQLTLECTYDNTWIQPPSTVISGYSTTEEMCTSVIYYYPKGRFSICGSNTVPSRLLSLFGINPVSRGYPRTIPSPQDPEGQRILEYLNSKVSWTRSLRNAVEREHTLGPHASLCVVNGVEDEELQEAVFSKPPSATYPNIEGNYKPVHKCLKKINKVWLKSRMEFNFRPRASRNLFYVM